MDNDFFGMPDGSILQTHSDEVCAGEVCCVHNPSDHRLKDAPLHWSSARTTMYRICLHRVPHPDPDHIRYVAQRFSETLALLQSFHLCCPEDCCGSGPLMGGQIV